MKLLKLEALSNFLEIKRRVGGWWRGAVVTPGGAYLLNDPWGHIVKILSSSGLQDLVKTNNLEIGSQAWYGQCLSYYLQWRLGVSFFHCRFFSRPSTLWSYNIFLMMLIYYALRVLMLRTFFNDVQLTTKKNLNVINMIV